MFFSRFSDNYKVKLPDLAVKNTGHLYKQQMSDKQWMISKSLQMVIAAMKLQDAYSLEGKLWPT